MFLMARISLVKSLFLTASHKVILTFKGGIIFHILSAMISSRVLAKEKVCSDFTEKFPDDFEIHNGASVLSEH